jgi:hypothetical protein
MVLIKQKIMRNKVKDKFHVLYWNMVFILLGLVLIGSVHGYLSQLASLGLQEANLVEEVNKDVDFQRRGATRITRSGREIVQDYSLGAETLNKKTESNYNGLFIGLLVVVFPFFLVIAYILFLNFSQLAVNRIASLLLIAFLSITSIFGYEFYKFYLGGSILSFVISFTSIVIIIFFALFASLQPNELSSPYYGSKTELDESLFLAA